MTKEEMLVAVNEKVKPGDVASKAAMNRVFDAVFQVIAEELIHGEDVRISGFGTFRVSHRAERKGRNPSTGEEIIIPASKAIAFKAGSALKEAVK